MWSDCKWTPSPLQQEAFAEAAALHEALRDAENTEEMTIVAAAAAANAHQRQLYLLRELQVQHVALQQSSEEHAQCESNPRGDSSAC